jgi:hypothetical protein
MPAGPLEFSSFAARHHGVTVRAPVSYRIFPLVQSFWFVRLLPALVRQTRFAVSPLPRLCGFFLTDGAEDS